jgi:hypothetical protein
LIAAARSQTTASSPRDTFSQAELTADRVITRCITWSAKAAPVTHRYRADGWILQAFEYKFYSYYMSSLAPDRLLGTPMVGPTTPSTPGWRLTAEQEATAVAELKQATAGWAALLAECAGLAHGYGEHQPGAARYRHIAELCVAAGVDQRLVEAWIEVGRQRASTAAATTHKACVLWDS